jgi:hypothetical protein
MFKKGNQAGKKEVTRDDQIIIRVTKQEKETIKKAADGNVSRYLLTLHRESLNSKPQ